MRGSRNQSHKRTRLDPTLLKGGHKRHAKAMSVSSSSSASANPSATADLLVLTSMLTAFVFVCISRLLSRLAVQMRLGFRRLLHCVLLTVLQMFARHAVTDISSNTHRGLHADK